MNAFPLVAAHLLECNQFTYDPRDEDVIVLKALRRRAKWRRRLSTIAVPLRWQGASGRSQKLAAATARS